jgi:hypothetical protein
MAHAIPRESLKHSPFAAVTMIMSVAKTPQTGSYSYGSVRLEMALLDQGVHRAIVWNLWGRIQFDFSIF